MAQAVKGENALRPQRPRLNALHSFPPFPLMATIIFLETEVPKKGDYETMMDYNRI